MSAAQISIGQVMMLVALAAVNFAVATLCRSELVRFPTVWVLMGSIDFVILWKLILKRSLRAFHYTFLVVFIVAYVVMANLVAAERLHPLGHLVRWYQQLTGEKTNSISLVGFLECGEFWMACFLTFALACAIGFVAAWLERRRGWDIAAFFRGALVGYGIAGLWATIEHAAWGGPDPKSARWIGDLVGLGMCVILGGLMGLSRLKSSGTGREGHSGSTPPGACRSGLRSAFPAATFPDRPAVPQNYAPAAVL